MSTLPAKVKEEFLAMLPPTIFFVALHAVALVRVLMLKGTGLAPSTTVSVTVAALILDCMPQADTKVSWTSAMARRTLSGQCRRGESLRKI
jgi:hypothetical protein